jgi:long-chain acyl-CoA synthetase
MYTLNAAMMLESAARERPEGVFLVDGDRRITYGEADQRARRLANVFQSLGVSAGDKIALLIPNVIELVTCEFGALKAGGIVVPITVTAPAPEVGRLLKDSGARILVVHEAYLEAGLEGFETAGTCQEVLIVNLPGSEACPEPAQRIGELAARARNDFVTFPTAPDDQALILYTSGTAGEPKGVLLSHFNLYFQARYMAFDFWQPTQEDVILMVAPGSHLFGQTLMNVTCLVTATLVVMPRFDPEAFLSTVQSERVTFFAGVPTIAHFMLSAPSVSNYDLSSLRRVMLGGAPIAPEALHSFAERFDLEAIVGYGLTEGVPVTYYSAAMMAEAPPGAVGKAAWGTTIRILNEQGGDVPSGEVGEVVVRAPHICLGYHNRPQETKQAFRDGWFHTGDVGRMDPEGNLFLVDRLKDVIKRSGYSIYPAEVEKVLHSHPAVGEAAVVGVPAEKIGEEIKAFVVLKSGAEASEEDLIEHCKAQLAAYKYPRMIEFRESLPKSGAGKILRRRLREAAT